MNFLLALLCAAPQSGDELRDVAESIAPDLAQYGAPVDLEHLAYEVRTVEEALSDLVEQQALFLDEEYWDAWHVTLRAWGGAVPPRDEFIETMVRGLTSGMRAYYHPPRGALVMLDSGLSELSDALSGGIDPIVAHELVHASQDQARGIAEIMAPHRSTIEAMRTQQCLLEGEAELVAALWASSGRFAQTDPEVGEPDVRRMIAGVGVITYEAGRRFFHRRWREGGREALDAAWLTPPASSEQILHPEKYPLDRPTVVELPDLPGAWHTNVLGELETYRLLALAVEDVDEAYLAAAGWDGDRLVIVRTSDGNNAVVWRSLWDRRRDAAQFERLLKKVVAGEVVRSGRVVDWLGACDEEGPIAFPEALRGPLEETRKSPREIESDSKSSSELERAWRKRKEAKSRVDGDEWILENAGIAISIPDGWELTEMNGVAMLRQKDAGRGFAANMNVQVMAKPAGADLDELARLNRAQLDAIEGLSLESFERCEVAGEPALYLKYGGVIPGMPRELSFVSTLWIRDETQVVVTATCTPEQWIGMGELLEELVRGPRALEAAE